MGTKQMKIKLFLSYQVYLHRCSLPINVWTQKIYAFYSMKTIDPSISKEPRTLFW